VIYLEQALKDGHAEIVGEGKQQKIFYKAVDHSERYGDPEEKVRAEFWAELIYRYQYEPMRIGIEITVPDRTPSDRADLVIFQDNERKRPYAVIECKKDGVTDAEFNQAVEQAYGNGTWAKFRADYVMVVAGATRRVLDCTDRYGALERDINIVSNLPIKYGNPEEYKYKKEGILDIQPVSKEALILAIRKCHQTLWGGGRLSPPTAFGELCKLIFVKISDEQALRKKGEPYEFQIKTHEESRRLAERIRALYDKQKEKDPDVFTIILYPNLKP
jgi:type I restriction enzyme M protein